MDIQSNNHSREAADKIGAADAVEAILLRAKIRRPFELTVSGTSMLPVLNHGDTISAIAKDKYEPGDILVFIYKQGEILVHRLLKFENERFYCKGDNSFRLEDIGIEQIIGAVILENDPHRSNAFIHDSYSVNRAFRRCKYNAAETVMTPEYISYRNTYLRPLQRYRINPEAEILEIDDDNMAVYDTESGDIHYIDNTGKVILDMLKSEISEDLLMQKLYEIYCKDMTDIDVPDSKVRAEITRDVQEFLDELIQKKVILCS